MAEQPTAEQAAAAPAAVRVTGHAVLLMPHCGRGVDVDSLPPDHQRILAIVRGAGGPVMVKQVGEELGLEVAVRGKLEPLRGKLSELAGRGWLRKLPDDRFTTRL